MTVPRALSNAATSQAALSPDTSIYITRFPILSDRHGESKQYPSWDAFFSDIATCADQRDLPGWSPSVFTRNLRMLGEVEHVAALVLKYEDDNMTMDTAFDFWADRAFGRKTSCFAYSTPDDWQNTPRFCVVIPFLQPVGREDFDRAVQAAIDLAEREGQHVYLGSKEPDSAWPWVSSESRYLAAKHGTSVLDARLLLRRSTSEGTLQLATSPTPKAASSASVAKGLQDVRTASEADRRKALNRVAFIAGLQIAGGQLDEAAATRDLLKAAIDAGFGAWEAEQVIARAVSEKMGRPQAEEAEGRQHRRLTGLEPHPGPEGISCVEERHPLQRL